MLTRQVVASKIYRLTASRLRTRFFSCSRAYKPCSSSGRISCLARRPNFQKQVGDHKRNEEVSTAMESSARFVVVLPLRHGGMATVEFSEGHYQLVGTVKPMNTYAVVGVGVLRDLEHIGRSVVVKFHGQCIRREDVVGDVTAPLSGDVFICGRVDDICRQHPTRE